MTTTFEDVVAHRDAMLDVFTEITQDCVLAGLAPCHVDVSRYSTGLHVGVQFTGTDTAAVDQVAGPWQLLDDNGTTGNYTRSGRLDIGERRVQVTVYTGRPKAPAFPAGYAPQAVEVEDGPDPHVCANCDHQRAFHHPDQDGVCLGLDCECAEFEELQAVEA